MVAPGCADLCRLDQDRTFFSTVQDLIIVYSFHGFMKAYFAVSDYGKQKYHLLR